MSVIIGNKNLIVRFNIKPPFLGRNPIKSVFIALFSTLKEYNKVKTEVK
jgi:hypothetical protein